MGRVVSTTWLAVATLALAASLLYLNSLSNPFVLDDVGTVTENGQIRSLTSPAVLAPAPETPTAGRPVSNISFAINYALGGTSVRGYHLVNIATHVACALLLFGLMRLLLARTDLAFATALIWAVHPLNSEVVDYVTQRTESLMAMFYLLTLYASVRATEGRNLTLWEVTAIAACALGMGSKESMVTAPLAVAIVDRIFLFDSFRAALRSRWRLYTGLAATWVILPIVLWDGPRSASAGFSTDVTVWSYLLNQAPLIVRYLRLAIWPSSLVVSYGAPMPLTVGDVLPYALAIVALLGLTAWALWRWPKAGFVGLWVFLTLAPTSSIVPIATEVGAERRMYLALAGVVALAVVAADRLLRSERLRLPSFAAPTLLAVTCVALSVTTFVRTREYQSAVTLTQTTVDRYPTPVAQHMLAENLLIAGRRVEALQHLRLALPGDPRAHYTLGVELYKDKQWAEAIDHLEAYLVARPNAIWTLDARGLLGQAYIEEGNWPKAIEEFSALLDLTPDNPQAHQLLADALVATQRYAEAVPHYRRYLATSPDDVDALNQLAISLAYTGQLPDAVLTLQHAVTLDPENQAVRQNLELMQAQLGKKE